MNNKLKLFGSHAKQMISLLPGFKFIDYQIKDLIIEFKLEHFKSIQNKKFNESVLKTLMFIYETQEQFHGIELDTNIVLDYINLIPKKKLTRTIKCDRCNKTFYFQMETHCKQSNCKFQTC